MQSTTIHPRIPDDLLKRLDEWAERTRRSRNSAIRLAIEEMLERDAEPPPPKRIVGRKLKTDDVETRFGSKLPARRPER